VFGPDRIDTSKASLAEIGPETHNAHVEVERLRFELYGSKKRIQRLVTNLEAQTLDSDFANHIRARLVDLGARRAKKQRASEAAETEMAQVPDPESAESLVAALPLLDVDWALVSDHDFRDLLAALTFETSYDPDKARADHQRDVGSRADGS
jgi:hypothetical protein